jgi:hypothetical protein
MILAARVLNGVIDRAVQAHAGPRPHRPDAAGRMYAEGRRDVSAAHPVQRGSRLSTSRPCDR